MGQLKAGIVICSRSDSKRVPKKVFQKVIDKTILEHLIGSCVLTELPVFIAMPKDQKAEYQQHIYETDQVKLFAGDYDPMTRMLECANKFKLDVVIRVCHDKICIDPFSIKDALKIFETRSYDYLYSDKMIDGLGFELISVKSLAVAQDRFKNAEHISYAVKAVTDNVGKYLPYPAFVKDSQVRLLIDTQQDLHFIRQVTSSMKSIDAYSLVARVKKFFPNKNKIPPVTVYTCVYNGAQYLEQCIASVKSQLYVDLDYIIVDDASTDGTNKILEKHQGFAKVIRNETNLGLSASSNVALSNARTDFIIRLDADDYFTDRDSVKKLLDSCAEYDAVYPANWLGSFKQIQYGYECHHVGGAIFNRRSLNELKFSEDLRNYDGYDLYMRAREVLKIGYLPKPTFFYRQHTNSMSKNNLNLREQTKLEIESKYGA